MNIDLKGKRVVITGASQGLGAVAARGLADSHAKMVLLSREFDKLESVRLSCRNPEDHKSIACDLTRLEDIHSGIEKAVAFLGEVDILMHVVGGGLGLKDSLLSRADMTKLFDLNIGAAVEINHLVVPGMIKKGYGNIVHVGSIASSEATGSVGYNTVKAALAAYVRTLGREIAGSGVIATGILPGGFIAPENSWVRLSRTKPEVVERFINEKLPRRRLADADEIIPLLLFLCSEHASMMSGCLVPIDAGEGKSYLNW